MLAPQRACRPRKNRLATNAVCSYRTRRYSERRYLWSRCCRSPSMNSSEMIRSCGNRRRILHSDYDKQGIAPLRRPNGDRSLVQYI